MPQDFAYKGSGTNKEGNHYCSRDYGPNAPNQNAYHYSNRDGGYYYSNPDGSKYYNNGQGLGWYTPPPRLIVYGGETQSSSASKAKSEDHIKKE